MYGIKKLHMNLNQGVMYSFDDSILYQEKKKDELQIFVKVRELQTEYDCGSIYMVSLKMKQ